MKRYILLLVFMITATFAKADGSVDETLFKSMHGHGSLNVVITVLSIILAGLFITLWRIDRKVSKLENEMNEKK